MSHMFFSVISICFNEEKQTLSPTPQRHFMCSFICFVVMLFVVEIYSVSAEIIISDAFSYSENV